MGSLRRGWAVAQRLSMAADCGHLGRIQSRPIQQCQHCFGKQLAHDHIRTTESIKIIVVGLAQVFQFISCRRRDAVTVPGSDLDGFAI